MPPAPHRSDTRPAEQVLEDLLRTWPSSAEPRGKTVSKRRPFATAFLPSASHQMPRLPGFRLTPSPMARVDLRPMREPADINPGIGTVRVPTPTFQAVADAIAARGVGSAALARAADGDADDAPELAEGSPECSEDRRFAAQVVALKAAGVLDPPAASGGGSPAPFGYADHYGGDAVQASVRGAEDASDGSQPAPGETVDPNPAGEPDWAQLQPSTPSSPFGSDDDIALPRSIFL